MRNDQLKVKLMTLWMRDNDRQPKEVDPYFISHGIWETKGMDLIDGSKIYTMVCIWPHHDDLKKGDTRRMQHDILLVLAHQVKIEHLPKVYPDKYNRD